MDEDTHQSSEPLTGFAVELRRYVPRIRCAFAEFAETRAFPSFLQERLLMSVAGGVSGKKR